MVLLIMTMPLRILLRTLMRRIWPGTLGVFIDIAFFIYTEVQQLKLTHY